MVTTDSASNSTGERKYKQHLVYAFTCPICAITYINHVAQRSTLALKVFITDIIEERR